MISYAFKKILKPISFPNAEPRTPISLTGFSEYLHRIKIYNISGEFISFFLTSNDSPAVHRLKDIRVVQVDFGGGITIKRLKKHLIFWTIVSMQMLQILAPFPGKAEMMILTSRQKALLAGARSCLGDKYDAAYYAGGPPPKGNAHELTIGGDIVSST